MTPGASVCPRCGHVLPAFKFKLAVGCLMLLVLLFLIVVTVLRHGYDVAI
jgi:hypothetical protein